MSCLWTRLCQKRTEVDSPEVRHTVGLGLADAVEVWSMKGLGPILGLVLEVWRLFCWSLWFKADAGLGFVFKV